MKTSVNTTRALGQFKTSIDKGIYEGNTPHISEWRTTTPNETVTLPYTTLGIYTGLIDWGDGTQSINSYGNRTHTYTTAGTYIINITGRVRIFRFANTGDRTKLYRVFQWGSQFDVGVGGAHFYGCTNLDLSVVSDVLILYRPWQLSNTQNFANMFRDCTSLTTINRVNEWDMSKIINLATCFYNCVNFNQDLNSWDVRLVTTMNQMFYGCTLFNGNISSWQTISVTDMSGMFRLAPVFNQDISAWDTADVTTMNAMFQNAIVFNQNIGNWNVSNVINMNAMFLNANNFNQNIGGWDVSNVTTMSFMFQNATTFNQNIGNWDIRNCLNFTNFMFGKTFSNYSTANYNALLIGWASRPVKPNISINFGTIKRTVAGTAARLVLTSPPNLWTIVDGGL
ncbi:MAG: BspA family leucine-rich repeat surface protein [Flavobacteriia bacterium]|nr:BspA family leucine-rich repeat surface protein [Flavobacteriia bacterium]